LFTSPRPLPARYLFVIACVCYDVFTIALVRELTTNKNIFSLLICRRHGSGRRFWFYVRSMSFRFSFGLRQPDTDTTNGLRHGTQFGVKMREEFVEVCVKMRVR